MTAEFDYVWKLHLSHDLLYLVRVEPNEGIHVTGVKCSYIRGVECEQIIPEIIVRILSVLNIPAP